MKKIGMDSIWVLALVALFAGCAQKDKDPETKYLVMGTSAEFPPFTMRAAAGSLVVGFDVEVAKAITDQVGLPLKIEEMAFDRLLPALAAGKVDLVLARLAITEERQRFANFSAPYYDATPVAVIVAGGPVPESKAELKGMKIGVLSGSKGEAAAKELTPADRVFRYEAAVDVARKLLAGEIECAILDEEQADHLAKKQQLLMVLRPDFGRELYGVAVKKGNGELLAQVNATLAAMVADGRHEQIVEQWSAPSPDFQE